MLVNIFEAGHTQKWKPLQIRESFKTWEYLLIKRAMLLLFFTKVDRVFNLSATLLAKMMTKSNGCNNNQNGTI